MAWTRSRLTVLAIALAAAAGTARLGLWQLDRAAQKNALQADIDRRMALPALTAQELAHDAAGADAQVHRRAEVDGRWLPQHTVWLDNRQMDGRPGFFVLTPLALDDGTALLVQRGWQPRDFVDRSRVTPPPTPDGPVRLAGRLARDPARLYDLGDEGAGPIRQNLQIEDFSRQIGLRLRPLTLLQTSPTDQDALRRDWPRPAAGVHTHYGYAFQWFALSALIVGLYVWFQLVRPARRA